MNNFTQLRFIAYRVPTVCEDAGGGFLEMPMGTATAQLALDGIVNATINGITNVDARERVARFYLAMITAATTLATLPDDRYTLKVFMAPEFYFRPTTANGTGGPAYNYVEYRQIKAALKVLSNEWRFRNWLIIPGTIMWTGTGAIGKRTPTPANVYFNSCQYVKVGFWSTQTHVLEKEQDSQIDGLPVGPLHPGNQSQFTALPGYYQTLAKRRKHVIEHYGTQCGVEICLEHGLELLKNVLSDGSNWRTGCLRPSRKNISLQLLTAGGMDIDDANVAVRNNGYILRNDGYGTDTVIQPQVEIRRVTGYVVDPTVPIPVVTTYGSIPSSAQYAAPIGVTQTVNLPGPNRTVPAPAGADLNFYFQQSLIIYNRVALP